MLHVRVGNIDFHDFTDSGFLIGPDGFKGWEGAPATRREDIVRPGQHGSFSMPVFKSGRLVAMHGHALADSEAELEHMGEVLAGIGQSEQVVVVQSAQGAKWGRASVEGEIKFDRVGEHLESVWSFTLFMPDPFKYGATVDQPVSAGDSVTYGNLALMSHGGNTVAHPRFTVTATTNIGAAGYQIKGKGRTFQVPGPLNVGSTDKVDFKTRTVLRNGVPVQGVIPQVFDVGGGELVEWRFWPLSGAGRAVPHVTDTFA